MNADEAEPGDAEGTAERVQQERDALTEPGGGDHRLRDQTAGREAQKIADDQVRERRNGSLPAGGDDR